MPEITSMGYFIGNSVIEGQWMNACAPDTVSPPPPGYHWESDPPQALVGVYVMRHCKVRCVKDDGTSPDRTPNYGKDTPHDGERNIWDRAR